MKILKYNLDVILYALQLNRLTSMTNKKKKSLLDKMAPADKNSLPLTLIMISSD
jgi:hypothetical protein